MRDAPIRLIAADLDGTLVHSTGVVTTRNQAALQNARAAGIQIAINTGRRHSYALRALRPLRLPVDDAVISSNGAVVRTVGGDLLWRETLSLAIVRRLLDELSRWRDALVFTFDLVGPDGADVPGALILQEFDHLHSSIQRWMESNAASIRRVVPLEDAFLQDDAAEPIQAMLCGTMARMREAEILLQDRFAGSVELYRTEYPKHDLCLLDIMPSGRSKGVAMLQFAERCGIPAEQIMAIGDNWNDLPMLASAGEPVVLANAPLQLKSYARSRGWMVGAPGDEDGVAKAIEGVLEAQR